MIKNCIVAITFFFNTLEAQINVIQTPYVTDVNSLKLLDSLIQTSETSNYLIILKDIGIVTLNDEEIISPILCTQFRNLLKINPTYSLNKIIGYEIGSFINLILDQDDTISKYADSICEVKFGKSFPTANQSNLIDTSILNDLYSRLFPNNPEINMVFRTMLSSKTILKISDLLYLKKELKLDNLYLITDSWTEFQEVSDEINLHILVANKIIKPYRAKVNRFNKIKKSASRIDFSKVNYYELPQKIKLNEYFALDKKDFVSEHSYYFIHEMDYCE